jgi:hypothetical protein
MKIELFFIFSKTGKHFHLKRRPPRPRAGLEWLPTSPRATRSPSLTNCSSFRLLEFKRSIWFRRTRRKERKNYIIKT